ncbi:murein biosynthesis integral membrane protein MurJ [Psychromarinibacter sp. C21-152]|uniref:Probable lipid II flippase MurJ n=1 Tax=Psychromarinibacter sediminicola TaxID=3033385 RepID=A0AAE3NWM8_9RHOB|nr:murein biosynthesis integral membrane protein MurJ [Psychromarinibacter sediminicola]MDF0603044.1 murein biosynthesis integral membrane protein MurJ [Psychromarinibacter sediminicola]
MKPIRLMAAFFTVGVWTMASRIFGFARDIMIAAFLGAGPVAEAFLIAFSLPNMFRRFFGEGAFNMAFVPMFSKRVETGDNPLGFARDAFSGLAAVLVVFSALATAAMPWLVLAMASGFLEDERFPLAVLYGRIAFPYILFISLAALLSGLLNAAGRFAAAAAAPVLLNVLFIAAMTAAQALGWDMGLTLAWTVPVAGIAQLALVWIAAARAGFPLKPRRPRLTPEMKRLAVVAAPAALAGGVMQVNLLIGRQVASFFDGAVAWLNYADRLYQLPLGVVGIAIGVVLLPDLSRRLGAEDTEGGRHAFNRAAEISLALTVPAAVALVVIPMPLIGVLFQRGAFGADDTAATALAAAVYGLGLPAFVLQKVLQPLYFAREDTKTPFYYALAAMVVNAVVAVGLAPVIGYIAAAFGTTLAGWAMVVQLWLGSRGMGEAAVLDARFKRRIWRILTAAVLMGLVLWLANLGLGPLFGMGRLRYLALAILVALGIGSYFGLAHAMGGLPIGDIRRSLRR